MLPINAKRTWILYSILIIFSVLFSVYGENLPSFEVIRQNNISVEYHYTDENAALLVSQLLENHIPALSQFYSMPMAPPVKIIIADSPERFNEITGGRLPGWTGAVYHAGRQIIVVKSPRWGSHVFNFETDIIHELSHAFFHKKFPDSRIPLWYNEGLAMYLSRPGIPLPDAVTLSNAIWARKIIPLKNIDSLLHFSQSRARIAYLQSLSAVLFLRNLLENTGEWEDFHAQIIKESWPVAFQKSLQMDEIDFEIKWYQDLVSKYRWLIFLNVENIIWILLLFILIFSLYGIRYRNRKRLKEWEKEEDYWDQYYSGNYPPVENHES